MDKSFRILIVFLIGATTFWFAGCASTGQNMNLSWQEYAPVTVPSEDLAAQGLGAVEIKVSSNDAGVFIVPFDPGIDFDHDNRVKLRDLLLESTPVEKNEKITLEPGKYVIAVRKMLSRSSQTNYDLGDRAPGNMLVGPDKDSGSEMVVGGGIKTGALFKAVKDVYLTYGGFLFAEGPGTANRNNETKYGYLKVQGTKDLMFRFIKEDPYFGLWLLGEMDVEPGVLIQQTIKVPSF